jgi:hypothetical protein
MPKNITPAGSPSFTSTIQVPLDGDSGDQRATDVESIAQELLDNTAALKIVTDDAVTRAGTQTVTGNKTFSGAVTASGTVTVTSASHVAVTGTGSAEVRLTSSVKTAVTGALTTTGNVIVGFGGSAGLTVKGSTFVDGDYEYNGTLPTRNVNQHILHAQFEDDARYATIPIEVPHGATVTGVRLCYRQFDDATQVAFTLRKRTITWGSASTSESAISTTQSSGAHEGVTAELALSFTQFTANNETETYYVLAECGASGGDSFVFGVRVTFADPGPRNF